MNLEFLLLYRPFCGRSIEKFEFFPIFLKKNPLFFPAYWGNQPSFDQITLSLPFMFTVPLPSSPAMATMVFRARSLPS